jgi:hypothetical protein
MTTTSKTMKITSADKRRERIMQIVALSDEQRARYYEAKNCGAHHDDAMEAAHS